VQPSDAPHARLPHPLLGVAFGQEIWLSYHDKAWAGHGYRYPRSREKALALVRDLCRQVHQGADIGALARTWSNAVGGRAEGFCAVPRPDHREHPDARDAALYLTPVGGLTPVLEWHGGFWFARRVDRAKGEALGRELQAASRVRARARVIHVHYAGAYPRRVEFDDYPKARAIARAKAILREILDGHATFEEMARKESNDVSRRDGGLLHTKDPRTGKRTEWIHWGDPGFPEPLLDVILAKATPGKVWPNPIVSGWGVDLVLVLERRTD
jgi:hypothetical protein